jgi:hypothetical protein
LLSNALSAITTAGSNPSSNSSAWLTSAAWPGVRRTLAGSPSPLMAP